nr:rep protein [Cressdnaviricota sp.]
MDNAKRSRGWCFTLNNYSEEEYKNIKIALHSYTPEFWIIGKEIGTEKKTIHLQGYIYWKNTKTFNVMKNMIPRAHLEIAKGNKKQNYEYCSKENNFECSESFKTINKIKYGGHRCIEEWIASDLFECEKGSTEFDIDIHEYIQKKEEENDEKYTIEEDIE